MRKQRNHALFWIDWDGNRELLYRDPAIPCLFPIPTPISPGYIPTLCPQTSNSLRAHQVFSLAHVRSRNLMDVVRLLGNVKA